MHIDSDSKKLEKLDTQELLSSQTTSTFSLDEFDSEFGGLTEKKASANIASTLNNYTTIQEHYYSH